MGNWRMVIEGTGVHHNGMTAISKDIDGKEVRIRGGVPPGVDVIEWISSVPEDADNQFFQFVKLLEQMGHKIHLAKMELLGHVDYKR